MFTRSGLIGSIVIAVLSFSVSAQQQFCLDNYSMRGRCLTSSSPTSSTVLEGAYSNGSLDVEVSSVGGYTFGKDYDPTKFLIGGAFRAYADSIRPESKALWGVVTEVVSSTVTTDAHLLGIESAVVNMNDKNGDSIKTGINVVFKNRMDTEIAGTVSNGAGENRYNENAYGVWVTAQGRSKAGEYSGFQAAIKVGQGALDRTLSRPYSAVIDYSDVESDNGGDDPYALVWRCATVKCGMRFNRRSGAMEFIRDIEGEREVRGYIDMNPATPPAARP